MGKNLLGTRRRGREGSSRQKLEPLRSSLVVVLSRAKHRKKPRRTTRNEVKQQASVTIAIMSWVSLLPYDNRVLLASLGFGVVSMAYALRILLQEYRNQAEIKPVQPKTQYITQDTEDSLRLGTLDTLLGHYNFAIRETAVKILCDRAANDGASIQFLLYGITRPDHDIRLEHLQCLAMIIDNRKFLLCPCV